MSVECPHDVHSSNVCFRGADITLFKDASTADTIIWSGLDSGMKRREFITLVPSEYSIRPRFAS